jgi:hypothetical protein
MKNVQQLILKQFHGKLKYLCYYLAGFADGESSFSVAILKTQMHRFGWAINPVFQVYQHQNHREILELYQAVLGTGRIYRKSGVHPVLNYSVDSRRNIIERVIPFFDKYPVLTKQDAYLKFRTIVLALENNEHQQIDGFKRIVTLAYSMNQQGKGRRRTLNEIFDTLSTST